MWTKRIQINSLSLLIWLNFILFIIPLAVQLWAGNKAGNAYGTMLYLLGGLQSGWVIIDNEWWRLLTSAFLHVDIWHLAANMFALWQLGSVVITYFGSRNLFTTYIFSGIAGSIVSIIFLGPVPTVGASGAVFGVIGLLLGSSMRKVRFGLELPFRPVDILPLVIYSLLIGLTPNSAVNNWAHAGGLVGGMVCSLVLRHSGIMNLKPWQKHLENALFYAAVFLFTLVYVMMVISVGVKLLG